MDINEVERQHQAYKKSRYARSKFITHFAMVLEGFPNYTIAEHLSTLMRKEGDQEKPYFWDDDKMLKKVETYYKNLTSEFSTELDEDARY